MLRPSQALSFRAVPSLKKLKIHHPLPLGPRESQQLLNLLTASFRKHLDTEHPTNPESAFSDPTRSPAMEKRHRRSSTSDIGTHPADRHMRSLLTNPLFNVPVKRNGFDHDKDPMRSFDRAVAAGMMNNRHAWACLSAKKRLLQSDMRKMGDSGAGFRVLRWLVSSGEVNKDTFLRDSQLLPILMEFMVAEGLQEAAWPWIERSLQRISSLSTNFSDSASRTAAYRDMVRPLLSLIRAEVVSAPNLDAAYMCLDKASKLLARLEPLDINKALRVPGRVLLRASLDSSSHAKGPSEAAFDSFLNLVPVICLQPGLPMAQLLLIHPTRPNPKPALALLKAIKAQLAVDGKLKIAQDENDVVNLGLSTAKFLITYDHGPEAEWVMEFLKTEYSRKLGIQECTDSEREPSDSEDIEFLRGLSIA